MTVKTEWVNVGTAAAKLTGTDLRYPDDEIQLIVRAPSAVDLFIGGADVTALNGYKVNLGTSIQIPNVKYGNDVYGILASGTGVATVLRLDY